MLAVGYGKSDITPPLGTPCALGLDDEAIEIFDPIHVRVLALTDAGQTVIILSADVIGFYQHADSVLRREIADRLRVPVENVVCHATHTHQSPCVRIEYGQYLAKHGLHAYSPEYWQLLRRGAVDAALEASRTLSPAQISFGEARVEGIASNRRLRMPDGSIIMRGSRDTQQRRAYPEGHIDPWVRVVRMVRDEDEVLLINYSCHPSASGGDEGPYVTADFPGYAMQFVEDRVPGSRAIYLTGPCGDVNPGRYAGRLDRRGDAAQMGERLGAAVLAARDSAEPVEGSSLRFKQSPIELPLRPGLPCVADAEREVEQMIECYRARKAAGETVPGGGMLNPLTNLIALKRSRGGAILSRVCGLAYGDLDIFLLPGECFLDIANAIRGYYGSQRVVCAATCDYTVSYVPTPEAYSETVAGYEGRVALVGPESFGIIAGAACRMFPDQTG